jgi:hypothetical protein
MRDIAHGQFNFLKIDQRAHENVEVDMLNKITQKKITEGVQRTRHAVMSNLRKTVI